MTEADLDHVRIARDILRTYGFDGTACRLTEIIDDPDTKTRRPFIKGKGD